MCKPMKRRVPGMDPIEPLIDLAIVTGHKCESCEIFDTNSICLLIMVDVFFTQSLNTYLGKWE